MDNSISIVTLFERWLGFNMFHKANENGKGDEPRKVNNREYDIHYINCYGATCPKCNGKGCGVCIKGKIYDGKLYFNLGGV